MLRVSSSDQKADLERHLDRIMQFGNACGHQIKVAFTEVGSGLNDRRPKLLQLLGDATIDLIIVEHRDRLVRFGFEYIEAALKAQGRKILVMDAANLRTSL